MSNATPYKGFSITEGGTNCFVTAEDGKPHPAFKVTGYGSMNAAKGAITKHLSKQEMGAFLDKKPAAPKAATSNDTDKASVPVSPGQIAYEQHTALHPMYDDATPRKTWDQLPDSARKTWEPSQPANYSHPATSWPFGVHAKQAPASVTRSRNKREGHYGGKTDKVKALGTTYHVRRFRTFDKSASLKGINK